MKILLHDYAGHPFQVQLSRELARRGHEVVHAYAGGLLTPRGALARRAGDPPGFSTVEVPMSPDYRANKYSFLKRRGYELAYGRELAALLARLRPDVVVSGNTPSEPQWTMISRARRLGVPVVSWVQDFYSIAVDKLVRKKLPGVGFLAGRWYRWMDARCFRHSAAIVAITGDFVPMLSAFGVAPDKVTVIPNWAPLDELPLRPKRNAWAARHGLEDKFVFLYTGTLAMKHNPELLHRLARHFARDHQVRVVVVSEGPGAEYLAGCRARGALDNLLILPFQDFGDMPEVLASADTLVAVLESDAGIFSVPSKVLTYLAAQRALLGAMPGVNLAARLIGQVGAGRCVEPDDADGFLAAAEDLRRDDRLRAEMGDRARAYACREFDVARIADRFGAMLASVCAK